MSQKTIGYTLILVGLIILIVGINVGEEGQIVANHATGEIWPVVLISKFNPWRFYYVTLGRWLEFLSLYGGGIAIAVVGLNKVHTKPRGPQP